MEDKNENDQDPSRDSNTNSCHPYQGPKKFIGKSKSSGRHNQANNARSEAGHRKFNNQPPHRAGILVGISNSNRKHNQNDGKNSGRIYKHHLENKRPRLKIEVSEACSNVVNKSVFSKGATNKKQPQKRKFHIGYNYLIQISEKEADETLLTFLNKKNEFQDFLDHPVKPELIVLFVNIIAKISKAEFNENKISVLLLICTSDFLHQLTEFITDLPVTVAGIFKENLILSDFFQNLLDFFSTVLNLMPSRSFELLSKIFQRTELTLKHFGLQQTIYNLPSSLEEKMQIVKDTLHNLVQLNQEKKTKMNTLEYPNPPYNFREISIYPSITDLTSGKFAFLRPNIVHGAYSSVEYYLDVQFHLLREDFIWPIRKGISELKEISKEGNKNKKIDNIKVYKKSKIMNVEIIQDQVCFIVQFDPFEKFRNLDWEHSKRFMHGSLLCFTHDNFASVILGTVATREIKYLKNGLLPVQLADITDFTVDLFNMSFTMIESEIFFEPYHHVLNGLKNMKSSNFPFQKYIIEAKCESDSPKYVNSSQQVKFDVNVPTEYFIGSNLNPSLQKEFLVENILELVTWPSTADLCLDPSQYKAFQSALTKEFVVIQGPPGTGKTFIGLRIAEFLLKNSNIWYHNSLTPTPLLVICYTNHALDQFLEGILKFTDSIIRVGSQSKNDSLQKYNLKDMRKGLYHRYEPINDYFNHLSIIRKTISDIDLVSMPDGILPIYDLTSHRRLNYEELLEGKHNQTFMKWLLKENARDKKLRSTDFYQDIDSNKRSKSMEGFLENVYSTSVSTLKIKLENLQYELNGLITKKREYKLKNEANSAYLSYMQTMHWCDANLSKIYDAIERIKEEEKSLHYYLNVMKKQLPQNQIKKLLENKEFHNLQCREKWSLYYHWLNELKTDIFRKLQSLLTQLNVKHKSFEEIRQLTDVEILRNAKVVGMTTTCAARLQPVLKSLKPKIVIVEEAAEVLESHIVVALTNHCEHLILIGDHKQLRPSTSVHKLAKQFNFDTSLFERMINNSLHCDTLKVQHRMRPEIAKLIVPSIYPELLNHKSVESYPRVLGVTKNLYFLNHNHPEEQFGDSSKMNKFEATFLLSLCRYLIQQGYTSDEITVLTTYTGQMFHIRKLSKQFPLLKDVRITAVDNFQGEENRIILLSLVRSNNENKIGFLKIENRVCVALSRAREGLFIVGNMSNLVASSEIWVKINIELQKQESVGEQLMLCCENHPQELTSVKNDFDFLKVPEGGCLLKCEKLLDCGHYCPQICHTLNKNHENYKCNSRCQRTCEAGHECKKLCYEDCDECFVIVEKLFPCGHTANVPCHVKEDKYFCKVKVEKILKPCNHKVEVSCGQKEPKCTFPCRDRLPCGHQCTLTCHPNDDPDHENYECRKPCPRTFKNCSSNHNCDQLCFEDCKVCPVLMERELPTCGHTVKIKCSKDLSVIICPKKCERIMVCGHPCHLTCGEICGNCKVLVTKVIQECGHSQELYCHQDAVKSFCKQKCDFILACGHKCDSLCGSTTHTPVEKCKHLVITSSPLLCGHKPEIECSKLKSFNVTEEAILKFCNSKCLASLECGHLCEGTCAECLNGRFHVTCKQKCGRTLVCGHSCIEPCSKSCPPCRQRCNMSCVHSQCRNSCGEPCSPCQEWCEWKCHHQRCRRKCFQLCNRSPCDEPCRKKLKCNHSCIGFCGEPCPPLCKICDPDKLEDFILGYEDEDSRYILLEDCNHVIESKGLDIWFSQNDGAIKLKVCPLCSTPVMKTMRFSNYVKEHFKNVEKVKEKIFGNTKETEKKRSDLLWKVEQLLKGRLPKVNIRGSGLKHQVRKLRYDSGSDWTPEDNVIFTPLLPFVMNSLQKRKKFKAISSREIEMIEVLINIIIENKENHENKFTKIVLTSFPNFLYNQLKELLEAVLSHVETAKQLNTQQVNDINQELQKLNKLILLKYYEVTYNDPLLKSDLKNANNLLANWKPYTKETDVTVDLLFKRLKEKGEVIIERKQIVQAMSLGQGHWYKCPNGHIYAIGDCGGAVQIGKCNECGAQIGGTGYRLMATNTTASEMNQSWS